MKEHVSTLVIANRSTVWDGENRIGTVGANYSRIIDCITSLGRIRWHNDDMIPVATSRKKLAQIEYQIKNYCTPV